MRRVISLSHSMAFALENIELVANVLQFVNRGVFASSFAKVAFQGAMDKAGPHTAGLAR